MLAIMMYILNHLNTGFMQIGKHIFHVFLKGVFAFTVVEKHTLRSDG